MIEKKIFICEENGILGIRYAKAAVSFGWVKAVVVTSLNRMVILVAAWKRAEDGLVRLRVLGLEDFLASFLSARHFVLAAPRKAVVGVGVEVVDGAFMHLLFCLVDWFGGEDLFPQPGRAASNNEEALIK